MARYEFGKLPTPASGTEKLSMTRHGVLSWFGVRPSSDVIFRDVHNSWRIVDGGRGLSVGLQVEADRAWRRLHPPKKRGMVYGGGAKYGNVRNMPRRSK